ncbi:PilW family protein [Cellulomonas triticagri]|uniref:PilW family protein n=1 Tax=Cellulomonas triticagri TaxID=2483352 RepID=UPI0013150D93|nr:hypothetical protein [Cellulomonas triticagri]
MSRRHQATTQRRAAADDGFSLAELMVASTIGLVALTVVSTAFVMVVRHQEAVVDGSHQVADAQVAVADVRRAVRNAAAVQVSADGQGLVVRTRATDGTAWVCRGWRWSEDGTSGSGTLYTVEAADGVHLADVAGEAVDPSGAAPAPPTTDPVAAGWRPAIDTVTPAGAGTPPRVFAPAPLGLVQVAFTVEPRTTQGSATALSTSVLPLPQDDHDPGGCF